MNELPKMQVLYLNFTGEPNVQKSILFSFVSAVKEFIIAIKLMGWFFFFLRFSFLFC